MVNLNFIYPEIFLSISIMSLLIIGVFKKNSSNLIYNLSTLSLLSCLASVESKLYPICMNVSASP